MFNVIFICTGNICRSPVAEAILRQRWDSSAGGELSVSSMGISGIEGEPASQYSRQICLENAIDISAHRSRPLNAEALAAADLILTMETHQKRHLQLLLPFFRDKIFLLGAWPEKETRKSTIQDPIGRRLKVYRNVHALIDHHINRIIPSLLQWATAR